MEWLGWIGVAFVVIGGLVSAIYQFTESKDQARQVDELKNQIIGGDGYAIVELIPLDPGRGLRTLVPIVRNRGKYLLYDIDVEIEGVGPIDFGIDEVAPHFHEDTFDVQGDRKFRVGTVIPEFPRKLESVLNLKFKVERVNISIAFYARNGFWRQYLSIYWPMDGRVEAAWVIRDDYNRRGQAVRCGCSSGFPRRENGRPDWRFGFGQHSDKNFRNFPEECESYEPTQSL